MPQTTESVRAILDEIAYEDWAFTLVTNVSTQGWVLQVAFKGADAVTGEIALQRGRKWLISCHSTVSEIVQTAFLAVLTAVEHEVREAFFYRQQAVFGPHLDLDELADRMPSLQLREPPQGAA